MTKGIDWNRAREAVQLLKRVSFDRLPPEWQQRIINEAFRRHPNLSTEVVLEKATQCYLAYVPTFEFPDFIESVTSWFEQNGWLEEVIRDLQADGSLQSYHSTPAAKQSSHDTASGCSSGASSSHSSSLISSQHAGEPKSEHTAEPPSEPATKLSNEPASRFISLSEKVSIEPQQSVSIELQKEPQEQQSRTSDVIAQYALKRRLLSEAKELGLTWTDIPNELRTKIANRLVNDADFRSKHEVKFNFHVDALMKNDPNLLEWLTVDELDIALREFKKMEESLKPKPNSMFPRSDVEPIEADWDKYSRAYFKALNAVLGMLVRKRVKQAGCYFTSREAEKAYLAQNWFRFLTDEELEVIRRIAEADKRRLELEKKQRQALLKRQQSRSDLNDAEREQVEESKVVEQNLPKSFDGNGRAEVDASPSGDDAEERKRKDDGGENDGGSNGFNPVPVVAEADDDDDDFAVDWSLGEIEFAKQGEDENETQNAIAQKQNAILQTQNAIVNVDEQSVSQLTNAVNAQTESAKKTKLKRKRKQPKYRMEITEADKPVRVEPYAAEIALKHKLELEFLFWLVARVLMGDRTKYRLSAFRWWLRNVTANKEKISPANRLTKTLLKAFLESVGGKWSEDELRHFLNDEREQRRVLEEYRRKRRKGKQTIQSGRTLFDRILKRGNHIFWEINEDTHSFYLFGTARVLAALGRLEGRIPYVTHLVEIPAKYIKRTYIRWLMEKHPKRAKTYAKALLLYIALNRLYTKPQSTFDFSRRFNMSRDTFYRLLKVAKEELELGIEKLRNYQVIAQLSYEEGMFGFDPNRTYNEFGEMLMQAIDEGRVDIVWTADKRLLETGFCFYKDLNGKKSLIRQLPNSYRLKSFRLIFSRKTKMGVWHRLKDIVVSMLNRKGWRDATGKLTIERFSELSAADRQWVLQAIRLGLVRADGWQIHRLKGSLVGSESAKRFNRFERARKNVRSLKNSHSHEDFRASAKAQAKWQRLRELELAYKAAMWRRFGYQPPSMDSVVVSEPKRGEVVIWAETAMTDLPVGQRIDLLVNGDDPEVVEALGAALYQRYLPLSYLPLLDYTRTIMPERLATALAKAFDAATVSPALPLAVKAVHARSHLTLFDRPDDRHFSQQPDAHYAHSDQHRPTSHRPDQHQTDTHHQRPSSATLSAPYARTVSDGDPFAFGYSALHRVAERLANAVRTSPQLDLSPPLSDLLVGQSEEKRSCAISSVSRHRARKRAHESDGN